MRWSKTVSAWSSFVCPVATMSQSCARRDLRQEAIAERARRVLNGALRLVRVRADVSCADVHGNVEGLAKVLDEPAFRPCGPLASQTMVEVRGLDLEVERPRAARRV